MPAALTHRPLSLAQETCCDGRIRVAGDAAHGRVHCGIQGFPSVVQTNSLSMEQPPRRRRIFTLKPVDVAHDDGRATNISILSLRAPHMRQFHLAWLGFFAAFTSWFAIPPLIKSIKKDLGIRDSDAESSNFAAVVSAIGFRLAVGPLIDRYGPQRAMAVILVLGSLPVAFTGLVSSGSGLIALRFFVGLLGASFVPCQAWATSLFSKDVAGSANAIVAGWGNMGGGFTYLVLPQIVALFTLMGLTPTLAWKVTLVLPFVVCVVVAVLILVYGVDSLPVGPREQLPAGLAGPSMAAVSQETIASDELEQRRHPPKAATARLTRTLGLFGRMLLNPAVLILMLHYALTFGVELAIDNIIGTYFLEHFKRSSCNPQTDPDKCSLLTVQTAGLLGSLFGLTNIFSRASGGILSDWLAYAMPVHGMPLRLLLQTALLVITGISVVVFSSLSQLASAVPVMVIFSLSCQMGCGTTFALVPRVHPEHNGVVSGLVGAGGSIGAAVFASVFKSVAPNYADGFDILGKVVLVAGIGSGVLLSIEGQSLWRSALAMLRRLRPASATQP
ncbi:major facilitator superfamily domain-containing protein [Entophlyctis helioformis]|nr:major facilitator superfamily domain-containing protein [Entophlyctis helioformis]